MLFQGGITPGELGNLTHDQLSHVDADAIAQIPVSKIQVSGARLFEKKIDTYLDKSNVQARYV